LKYRESRPYLHESSLDIMFGIAAANRVAEKKRIETNPPPPPTISPIRSPFEEQLPAIQRAIEVRPLKQAAGAEGLDLLALANAEIELPTRRPTRSGFLLTALNDRPRMGAMEAHHD